MSTQEVLILAMTKMLSGICTAGFTCEEAPTTGLCWVRPTRAFGTVLPGDMMGSDGRLFQCGDVVELTLLEPRPNPPHIEDWVTDFVYRPPKLLRRLSREKRAAFFADHQDQAPEDVLCHHTRSLCLVQARELWSRFSLDPYSGKYQARLGFTLACKSQDPRAQSTRGVPVTDLKWRALGRTWLGDKGGVLELDHKELVARLDAEAFYLTLGLSRKWKGQHWLLAHAVHVVPDYTMNIDPSLL